MEITLLKAKIHRAVVTQADLNYVGSVTIDSTLLQESGILEYEKVQIVFFNDTAPTEIYTSIITLSLHDSLPIYAGGGRCPFAQVLRNSLSGHPPPTGHET